MPLCKHSSIGEISPRFRLGDGCCQKLTIGIGIAGIGSKRARTMLKIQRFANGEIVFILCGRMDAEQAAALNKLFLDEHGKIQIVVDLKDLTLVDRDAVRFLERCEVDGIELRNSPAYIRVWIDRERGYARVRDGHRSLPDATPEE